MKLSDEKRQLLESKLSVLWKDPCCEICGSEDWIIDSNLYEVREFHGAKTILGSGAIKPYIIMECKNCGNAKFLNALSLGIIDKEGN